MDPLLVVIVTFGLIFVVTASLGQGFSIAPNTFRAGLAAHGQLSGMLLISNFILMPALVIGLAALLPFDAQVKMAIIVLGITAGSPFIPYLVSKGKGDLGYSVVASFLLLIVTLILVPFAVPPLLGALDTGATPSPWDVAWPMLVFIALPAVIGIVARKLYPAFVAEVGPWLGPLSVTFLLVHICLFLGYTWSEFLSLAGDWQLAFILLFPLGGMLIGYLLSPPYVLSPLPVADPQRPLKLVSSIAVAQQNTGAVICCAIFPLGAYEVAGDYLLVGALATIVVVLGISLELARRSTPKTAPDGPRQATVSA